MFLARLFLCCLAITCAFSEEIQKNSDKSDFKTDCDNSYTATCLKLDIVSWVDALNEKGDISVLPGVSLVRENVSSNSNTAEIVAELGREFPNDPNARLDSFLMKKVQGFLGSHSLKLNFAAEQDNDNVEMARRKGGKKGGGGGMGMILAAGAMMKSTLLALGLGALAALAGKALMTALISLVLSAIIGLKSLTGGGEKTTYEVVSKPVYTHSSSHSSGHEDHHHGQSGWNGRSFDTPLPLGLRPEYKPA
ncbi:unnamed protein product [Psylliodes chrysocephalus]|uniref:Osiris 16 n=1 Tax=Psylliodes chrysocephalus TaxID=3402493 RepID=A0A9P0D7A1_9CUCU|nr:unnamed protein product [Psylliodes chrysocephala]